MATPQLFSLRTPQKIIAGMDSIESLPDMVADFSIDKVAIITDRGVWNAGLVDKPKAILESRGIRVEVVNTVPPEPEMGQVLRIFETIKRCGYQMLIGIGGGSAMDVTKILAALLENPGLEENILEVGSIRKKGLPTIMVPTTAGTGSEATPNAIVTLPEQELKIGIVSDKLIPDCVILDPVMTAGLPGAVTASTGMDAFTHATECYTSKKANPISDMFALKAIELISRSIRKAYDTGEDYEARQDMLLGAFYAGVSITSSGTTAVHAMSYPLGGKYKIPHGIANSMLLPHVMEFNMDAIQDRLADVAAQMGIETAGKTNENIAEDVVRAIFSMAEDLKIPSDLKKYGITDKDLDGIADAALKVTRLLDNNRKAVKKEDMKAIYQKLL